MSDETEVLEAARRRAEALAGGDAGALGALLHPRFRWSTHTGQRFDRATYVERNTGGTTVWLGQELWDAEVLVEGATAVLLATAVDSIRIDSAATEFRMPVTLTWVRDADGWRCLAGHAGPRLEPDPA